MPLVDFTDFMDQVLAEVRIAPEELAIQKLREIARDFCQMTRAWQEAGPATTIAANTATYTIVPPGDAEPVALEYLAVNNVEVVPKQVEWLDRFITNWRTRSADDFRYFTQLTRKTFTFPALPTVNGTTNGVTYRMSLKPGIESNEINEDVWAEWSEVITKGAKAELLVMDGERWANVKRGGDYRGQYQRGRAAARIRAWNGYGNAEGRWVSPYRFAGR